MLAPAFLSNVGTLPQTKRSSTDAFIARENFAVRRQHAQASKERVERLMRDNGIYARHKRRQENARPVLSFDGTHKELYMETFSIRDLRERTGELARTAEAGQLSIVTKHGRPVFIAAILISTRNE